MTDELKKENKDFVREIIDEHNLSGRFGKKVCTRFPPEPNAYLHIGHAKSINLNYGIAKEYGGTFNLRFDDTNPLKEEQEYVEAIIEDVKWLGADFGKNLFYASDYFDQLYEWAIKLIKKGKAYICDLPHEVMREYRGTLTVPGKDSPYRNRSVEENLDLFVRMKNGEFEEGSKTLRAKIDMASPNMNMRDPVMYRIMKASHHRQGDKWCIYPTYDFTHGQSDSIEKITHSICTLEFEDHRPLYDWYIDELEIHHPQQIEFARLNMTYSAMSKRFLKEIVEGGYVHGWDDPRMITISGLRRRGYTPEAVRAFCNTVGVAKADNTIEVELLEHCLREDLNKRALRVMAVLNPLKVVIENYPDDLVEDMDAVNNPEDLNAGTHKVPFSKVIYIEREDFMEDPPKKFYRLAPGREIRLRYAYFIKCVDVIKDSGGNVIELRCTYDPATRGGNAPDDRKVKATLHWVSVAHALKAEARIYDKLFRVPDPMNVPDGVDWKESINSDSLKIIDPCHVEPILASAKPGDKYQFERIGYFCVDPDSTSEKLVFNRTVTLRDEWAKLQKRQDTD